MTTLDPNGARILAHGYGGYSRGCRCEVCRRAKADYMQVRRSTARDLAAKHTDERGRHLASGITHGTVFGYEERGCRCRPCTTAIAVKRAREVAAQRARLLGAPIVGVSS
jgi:hypothetical protein